MLKNPAKDQVLSGGSYFEIVWEGTNIDNIKIEFSYNGGTTWETVVSSYPVSATKYPWLVPAKPTTQGKIRITDISTPTSSSTNTGFFTISQPSLSFLHTGQAPVGGQIVPLSWDSRTVAKVNLYYSLDSGSTYSPIIKNYPALAANYLWLVPSIQPRKIRFKVESVDSAQINSIWDTVVTSRSLSSNQKFRGGSFDGHSSATTLKSKINLIYPAGNENIAASSAQNIQWSSTGFEHVKLEFSADSGLTWLVINASYPATARKFEWKVPDIVSQKAFIRISSLEDPTVVSKNASAFKIPSKSIALVETDSLFIQGQPIPISWINNGVDNLSINYRTVGGGWNSIIDKFPASNSYFIWVPPAGLTSQALQFKLSSTDRTIQDSSKVLNKLVSGSFSSRKFKGGSYDGSSQQSNIVPTIQILTPASSTKLNGLSQTEITWKTKNVESIDLSFSSDSGKTWVSVIKNYAGSASKYSWQVPFSPTKNGLLKIISSEDTTIQNVSSRFEITEGFVTITADSLHDGGAQTLVPIKWEQSGMDKVDISFRPAATLSWQKIITNYQASAGYFLWIPASKLTGDYLIKLNKSGSSVLLDSIPVIFQSNISTRSAQKYKGGSYDGFASRSSVSKISITKPQSGEILIIGSKYVISWNTVNVSDSVKIEYSTDNGLTWKLIAEAVDASSGTYEWFVPGVSASKSAYGKSFGSKISSVQNECKIRISDKSSKEVIGFSDNTFMITEMPAEPLPNQINFPKISDKMLSAGSFVLKASTPSELPLTFSILSGPASVLGNTVTLTGLGEVTVKVQHPGNTIYKASESVQTFKVLSIVASEIVLNQIADRSYSPEPFSITATTNSGANLSYEVLSGPAVLNESMLTLTGKGQVKIKVSHPAQDPYPATSIERIFNVLALTPDITFGPIADRLVDQGPLALNATSSSSTPVIYSIVSGPGKIDGSSLLIQGTGKVILKVTDPGNNIYNPLSKNFEFTVYSAGSISFPQIPAKTYGDRPVRLLATTNTGLPVKFKINSGPGILRADSLVFMGAGKIGLEAYYEASQLYTTLSVKQEVIVNAASQSLTFATIPDKSLDQSPFNVSASSSSGLGVYFTVVSGPATVQGSAVTLTGPGLVTIRATTLANPNYLPVSVERSFSVSPFIPRITLNEIPDVVFGTEPVELTGWTNTGLPLSYSVLSGPAETIGIKLKATGVGQAVVRVSHNGNGLYKSAYADRTVKILPGDQQLYFEKIGDKVFGDKAFVLFTTSKSNQPVKYKLISGHGKVVGNSFEITGAGTVVVRASQEASANYNSAVQEQTFKVEPADQKLVVESVGNIAYTPKPFDLSISKSTDQPIVVEILSGPAKVVQKTIHVTGVGDVRGKVTLIGSSNYRAAIKEFSFMVSRAGQTIKFDELVSKPFGSEPFEIKAASSSGLPLEYTLISGPATLQGKRVVLTGTGLVKIRASQAGNDLYTAAELDHEFRVEELLASNFTVQMVSAACAGGKTGQIKIDAFRNLNYTAQIEGPGFSQTMNFIDTLTLSQLAAGKYAICIEIEGASGFEQCFNVVVKEPEDLKMFTSVDMVSNELNILMSGSEFFNIDLNGVKYRTNQTRFTLPLRDGINTISLSTDLYCQGIIVKKVLGGSSRIVFPNPFKDVLKLDLTRFDEPVNILVIDMLGRTVYRSPNPVHRRIEEISLSHVSMGALYVKLVNSNFEETFKVFKD